MVLSVEEKKERKRIASKKYCEKNKEKLALKTKEYYHKNKEKESQRGKKYRQENKEKVALKKKEYNSNPINKEKNALKKKEYSKTPNGKKVNTLKQWKGRGLIASKEEKDRIYNLYLNQELCNACDCILTRTGKYCKTDANMDHCHETGRFRHIICHSCNVNDNWKKHFC